MTDPSLATYAAKAPVTGERKLNTNLQKQLPEPYLARALVAIDTDHPKGTEGKDQCNMSVLQQHVAFFDRNKDGIVYPWETYLGFRAVGFNFFISLLMGFIINFLLGYSTQTGWLPNPLLRIYISNIHKCKHGSDSETYDTEGRFEPSKFEAIFSKYARTNPNALTKDEIITMLNANHNFGDILGRLVSALEWALLYSVGKDENGLLQKEAVRGAFDGSLFEKLEKMKKKGATQSRKD